LRGGRGGVASVDFRIQGRDPLLQCGQEDLRLAGLLLIALGFLSEDPNSSASRVSQACSASAVAPEGARDFSCACCDFAASTARELSLRSPASSLATRSCSS